MASFLAFSIFVANLVQLLVDFSLELVQLLGQLLLEAGLVFLDHGSDDGWWEGQWNLLADLGHDLGTLFSLLDGTDALLLNNAFLVLKRGADCTRLVLALTLLFDAAVGADGALLLVADVAVGHGQRLALVLHPEPARLLVNGTALTLVHVLALPNGHAAAVFAVLGVALFLPNVILDCVTRLRERVDFLLIFAHFEVEPSCMADQQRNRQNLENVHREFALLNF